MPAFFGLLALLFQRRLGRTTLLLVLGLTNFAASLAQANEPPRVPRSTLENSYVDEALAEYGWEEDPNPEGKTIEEIKVHVFHVFDHRDPIPNFLNIFHARTREWVAKQEVLQQVGDTWSRRLVLETERNLRGLRQLSLANVVAVRGSRPDRVRFLVVVKDVWSLRLNSNYAYGTNGLDLLLLNPTEENLVGLRASLGALFALERDRYTLGGVFSYPRMLGTKYTLVLSGGGLRNRFDHEPEGTYGSFAFGRPLWNRRDRWAYGTSGGWSTQLVRKYVAGELQQIEAPLSNGEVELVPWMYEAETLNASYYGIRSFGFLHKIDVGFGLELDHRRYRQPEDLTISAEAVDVYRRVALPVSDRRISPYVSLASYKTDFHRVLNLETLSIQEDWRLGYGVFVNIFAAAEELGSSRNLIGSRTSLGYTIPVGDGLLRGGVSNRIVVANENRHEAFVSVQGRFVTPSFLIGRLHLDGYLGHRYQDYLNVPQFRLGGNNRLRGYAAGEFFGKDLVVANAEFRTRGVDILSAQVGLAGFYDVGGTNDVLADIDFYQGVGGGLRILFPQAERIVMRLDWGLPISGDRSAIPGSFFFTFGQAFPMPDSTGGGAPF